MCALLQNCEKMLKAPMLAISLCRAAQNRLKFAPMLERPHRLIEASVSSAARAMAEQAVLLLQQPIQRLIPPSAERRKGYWQAQDVFLNLQPSSPGWCTPSHH